MFMNSASVQTLPLIKKQAPMTQVLYALIPLVLSGIYLFGWRVAVMLVVGNLAAFLTEYAFVRGTGQQVTAAVFVTGTLLVMSLSPLLPIWMVVVGAVFAVAFGKMMFGGFGRNVFNPALVGRAFLYISFGGWMTAHWGEPVPGAVGGFGVYTADVITQATPGILLKTGTVIPFKDLFIGTTAGTVGGTSTVLAIAGGLYLIMRKTANWRIALSGILGFCGVQGALWLAGVQKAAEPLHAMVAGSFLFGIFYFATEPVTASKHAVGRWIYGFFIGAMSSLIGVYSVWPAGTMFAILLANMFTPIMDYGLKQWDAKRAVTKKAVTAAKQL
jgi:Na+-transporting NADH:ubiquinone oxidoreductase subunit B